MNNEILKEEIRRNLNDVKKRLFVVLPILLKRYFLKSNKRTPISSYQEYDKYWDIFWERKDLFRTDLPFMYHDKQVGKMTPFEYKNLGPIKIISKAIESRDIKSVCEIGSGAGLNLLILAPLFPDVNFLGIEPTESGVRITKKFINNPPFEFENAFKLGKVQNIEVIQASILDSKIVEILRARKIDLIFSSAVFEQLNNYIEIAINNAIDITDKYFLFIEEWLEANYLIDNYITLVKSDYFRISWNYLNNKDSVRILKKSIPALQPGWLKYGVVFGKKVN